MTADKAQIHLRIYDGSRQPFSGKQAITLRVHNGSTMNFTTKTLNTPSLSLGEVTINVDYFDNFADNYTVLISADGYRDAGFYPVKVSPKSPADVTLMLVAKGPEIQFDRWDDLAAAHPKIASFLSLSVDDAKDNYSQSFEDHPEETACLLNLATAMSQIFLANGTPLDYFRGIEWKTLARDRFFGYVVPELKKQIEPMVPKFFVPELDPQFFHGDATCSFKQIDFGEANVQLTFHENTKVNIGAYACVRIEPDIDYFKDLGAHAIFEVIPNQITHSLTDPIEVYVLRWMAGKQAGRPEFEPPYRLV